MELFRKEAMVRGSRGWGDGGEDEDGDVTRGFPGLAILAGTGSAESQG